MTAQAAINTDRMSAECAVAQTPGYEDLHDDCRQAHDLLLPGSTRIVLQARCYCTCHPAHRPRKKH